MQRTIWYLALLIFVACSGRELVSLGDHILKIEDNIEFESGLNLEITFVEDNRCPLDSTCVWTGEAVVTFNIEFQGNSKTFN